MSISKTYNPQEIEKKWYTHWIEKGFFKSSPNPEKQAYTIVIPPPNVTGVLHMGHMLNNTIQDVLIRRARMLGKEACWVPGTDHASIATEAKVVAMLKEKGISKSDLSREEFLKHAWAWKEKYGGIILDQLKKLGASCDWDRTRFTMEESLSEAVTEVFVSLFEKGYIYRGARMVNWDPQSKTAVSDEEVIYKEGHSKLHHIKYMAENGDGYFTIATTRPETIMGDVAICVHPEDERYKHLIGKKYVVPLINRAIPIITDEAVDMEFGTGSLKVTPAHDLVDYNIGLKYNLEVIDVLNEDGTIAPSGQIYVGEDRFVARKKIVKELEEKGYLIESKDIINKVGTSERTGAVIEPRISIQWFCKMEEMAKPALTSVMDDSIQLHPAKFKNTYKHWLENIKDWCISRQLWWGHRIPVWYLPNGSYVVAKSDAEALEKARKLAANPALQPKDLQQDPDVLDTWFSSWLWPISVFDGFKNPDNDDIKYYYPTNDLVTAPEILFFWVARMIMAGYEFKGKMPFKNVYLTGIVRDKLGRKMSKQLGNSPDPLELIDQYGADGVRVGMLLSSPAGNDLMFDEKLIEQGRNFSNKIWNAFRLISGLELTTAAPDAGSLKAVKWLNARIAQSVIELEDLYAKFRLSDALNLIYKLVWDDLCSAYLEIIKPEFGKPLSKEIYRETVSIFETILKILHPFMPFITEELWHELGDRNEKECIIVAAYPVFDHFDNNIIIEFERISEIVTGVRNIRNTKQIPPKQSLELVVKTSDSSLYLEWSEIIKKLSNVSLINFSSEKPPHSISFLVKSDELSIPVGELLDQSKERDNLEKELIYLQGFLTTVDKKLSNEKFVQNAKPEVLQNELNKKADAEAKIRALQLNLTSI